LLRRARLSGTKRQRCQTKQTLHAIASSDSRHVLLRVTSLHIFGTPLLAPRLTNAFNRKIENHAAAIALYYFAYNFVRIHRTLRVTLAMASGVTDRL